MGWEITNFQLERTGELARVFNFEIMFTGLAGENERLVRGDGLVMKSGKIRFNRENQLMGVVAEAGINPDSFSDYFTRMVAAKLVPLARAI